MKAWLIACSKVYTPGLSGDQAEATLCCPASPTLLTDFYRQHFPNESLACESSFQDLLLGNLSQDINPLGVFENMLLGASLVVQWLRIRLPVQGTQVRALVREDPTCRGATKPVRHNY